MAATTYCTNYQGAANKRKHVVKLKQVANFIPNQIFDIIGCFSVYIFIRLGLVQSAIQCIYQRVIHLNKPSVMGPAEADL